MIKNIYQLAIAMQENGSIPAEDGADLEQDIQTLTEDIIAAASVDGTLDDAEGAVNLLKGNVYDKGFVDGVKKGAWLIVQLLSKDPDKDQ